MLYELRREACMKYEYDEAIPVLYLYTTLGAIPVLYLYTTLGETEGGDGKLAKTVYLSKKA